jgi:hypothetical protein
MRVHGQIRSHFDRLKAGYVCAAVALLLGEILGRLLALWAIGANVCSFAELIAGTGCGGTLRRRRRRRGYAPIAQAAGESSVRWREDAHGILLWQIAVILTDLRQALRCRGALLLGVRRVRHMVLWAYCATSSTCNDAATNEYRQGELAGARAADITHALLCSGMLYNAFPAKVHSPLCALTRLGPQSLHSTTCLDEAFPAGQSAHTPPRPALPATH